MPAEGDDEGLKLEEQVLVTSEGVGGPEPGRRTTSTSRSCDHSGGNRRESRPRGAGTAKVLLPPPSAAPWYHITERAPITKKWAGSQTLPHDPREMHMTIQLERTGTRRNLAVHHDLAALVKRREAGYSLEAPFYSARTSSTWISRRCSPPTGSSWRP